ncbi:Hypothetical predicted protein [Mytilus galloprovincialis]|uniref:SGNH hydrolase-type esterase domain-containing protein n=1 Tax=Mytilus galloprovincialis TaxID=29158 RepID=A0A8B6C8Y8_MYTGA|nr:Hypothetical predicted protein [Mytilus galloprovincialis]
MEKEAKKHSQVREWKEVKEYIQVREWKRPKNILRLENGDRLKNILRSENGKKPKEHIQVRDYGERLKNILRSENGKKAKEHIKVREWRKAKEHTQVREWIKAKEYTQVKTWRKAKEHTQVREWRNAREWKEAEEYTQVREWKKGQRTYSENGKKAKEHIQVREWRKAKEYIQVREWRSAEEHTQVREWRSAEEHTQVREWSSAEEHTQVREWRSAEEHTQVREWRLAEEHTQARPIVQDSAKPNENLLNASKSGANFENFTQILDIAVQKTDSFKVDKVAICLGTNDISKHKDDSDQINLLVTKAVAQVKSAYPESHVGLCSIIPRKGNSAQINRLNQSATSVNKFIRKLCAREDNVDYVDLEKLFYKNGTIIRSMFDKADNSGVHINTEGAQNINRKLDDFFHSPKPCVQELHTPMDPKRKRSDGTTDTYLRG